MTASASSFAPSARRTPSNTPSSITSACTVVLIRTSTLRSRRYFSMASTTWTARSLCGKTRLPRSILSGTPSLSKNAITSALSKARRLLLRNLPFPTTFLMMSGISSALVTLQRPFPVIIILRPTRGIFSSRVTLPPCSAAAAAAIIPAGPAPTTRIFPTVHHPSYFFQFMDLI